jgi:hypothetical protein
MQTRTKKIKNNEFVRTPNHNFWVRNFCNYSCPYVDINSTTSEKEYFLFLENEFYNNKNRYPWIDSENIYYPTIAIVSDGYDFENSHKFIDEQDICIFAVNGALKKWKNNKSPNYYIVNNPYNECLSYLPRTNRTLPKCIASSKTNHTFLERYNGIKYKYYAVNEEKVSYSGSKENMYQVDDYRNVICASINLAYRFQCKKLLLLSCDDSFVEEKPGSIKLENGLYSYPQQNLISEIIDSCLYWVKDKIEIKYYGHSKKLDNAGYIQLSEVKEFTTNENTI